MNPNHPCHECPARPANGRIACPELAAVINKQRCQRIQAKPPDVAFRYFGGTMLEAWHQADSRGRRWLSWNSRHPLHLRHALEGLSPQAQQDLVARRPLVRVVVEPTATQRMRAYYALGSGTNGKATRRHQDAPGSDLARSPSRHNGRPPSRANRAVLAGTT